MEWVVFRLQLACLAGLHGQALQRVHKKKAVHHPPPNNSLGIWLLRSSSDFSNSLLMKFSLSRHADTLFLYTCSAYQFFGISGCWLSISLESEKGWLTKFIQVKEFMKVYNFSTPLANVAKEPVDWPGYPEHCCPHFTVSISRASKLLVSELPRTQV